MSGWFLLSCFIRYLLELCGNVVFDAFWRDTVDWKRFWTENGCQTDTGKAKFICKAYEICLNEVIPAFIPSSGDDLLIQLLLIVIIKLVTDKAAGGQERRND